MPRPLPDSLTVDLTPDEMLAEDGLRDAVALKLGVDAATLPSPRIRKRSIDARHGRVRFHVHVDFDEAPRVDALGLPDPRPVTAGPPVVIVGMGPAGLFAAYELARHGIACTIVDRGKPVQPRRRDLALLNRGQAVSNDSNYCFGEGGAGTYSDGKLYTRAGKRGDIRDVLEILVKNGATPRILEDARPHIGSNKLPKVITAIRERLIEAGVRFRFEARVADLLRDADGHVEGVQLASGEVLPARHVVLATGHSARDIFTMLDQLGVRLEAKPFALGVRIEHDQRFIDATQYGGSAGHPVLPAAYYRIAHTENERGVFSFCMCPGGWIVPAMTDAEGHVVNGMSLSKRDSPFANSGFVVEVGPNDWEPAGHHGPLGGISLQRQVEAAALSLGREGLRAPATRADDFLRGEASRETRDTSYLPGLTPADLSDALDAGGVAIAAHLRRALHHFEQKMPGYAGAGAQLIGVETRTSAPVRIPRDPRALTSPDLPGLYPTGEGAGYAGGIVSAAMDGIRVARAIARVVPSGAD